MSYYNLYSSSFCNMCGHPFATNPFRRHETLQNGESPWIKSKARGKSMYFILIEGKITPKVTRACGLINSQKAKQLVLHLWMYQQSVRKKNGSEASRRKQCYRRVTSMNEPSYGLFLIVPLFIVRNECLVETMPRHLFVELLLFSFLSFTPLLTTAKTRASLNTRCGTSSLVCFCFGRSTSLSFRFAHS